jgi:hypothetical protein
MKSTKIYHNRLQSFYDGYSYSGKQGTLLKGQLTKPLNQEPASFWSLFQSLLGGSTKVSKSTYFVKPTTAETKDQKAVIVSRQMHETVAHSKNYKNIKIAKQRLYGDCGNFSYVYPKAFMVSKEVEGLEQKRTGKDYQYQYYLGMAQIAGEPDWNPANIGKDKDDNLAVIDIGGPSIKSGNYIGSYLFWEDFLLNTVRATFKINEDGVKRFRDLLRLSGAPKGDFFGIDRDLFAQQAKMSYKTFNDFMTATINDAYKFTSNDKFIRLTLLEPNIKKLFDHCNLEYFQCNSEYILGNCNEVLSNTKEGSDLYNKITAYIDGATEFYYNAPSAKIEEKHILGGDLKMLEQKLGKIQDIAFEDFCQLIKGFNNKKLSEYLEKKIEREQAKNGICDTSNEHNSLPESKLPFFSKIHQLNEKKITKPRHIKNDIAGQTHISKQSTTFCSPTSFSNNSNNSNKEIYKSTTPFLPAPKRIIANPKTKMTLADLLDPHRL